jgi:hypothetical protein
MSVVDNAYDLSPNVLQTWASGLTGVPQAAQSYAPGVTCAPQWEQ